MRLRYSKIKLTGNVHFSPYLIDASASFGGDPKKSAVHAALSVWDFRGILGQYHEKAKANSDAFGCANCLGMEVLRSCLCARAALNEPALANLQDLNALAVAYPGIAASAFGASSHAWYEAGLKLGNADCNLMKRPSYAALKGKNYKALADAVAAANAHLGDGPAKLAARAYSKNFLAVTKPSANAHAVLSRAELKGCVRYALCEYLVAAIDTIAMRTEDVVRTQAIQLAIGNANADATSAAVAHVRQAWAGLSRQLARDDPGDGRCVGFLEFSLGVKLLGWLVAQLAEATSTALAADTRRAVMAGLCALVRRELLRMSRLARRCAPDLHDFVDNFVSMVCASSVQPILGYAVFDAKKTAEELPRIRGAGRSAVAQKVIDEVSLDWGTEDSVEFGHQCGSCETAQGDGSLIRRMTDYRSANGHANANPIFGVTYADLSLTDAAADTAWDLSSAVTCQAVEVLMRSVHSAVAAPRGADRSDFLLSLIYHCNNTPWLFVAYFEVVFLEMAYSDPDPDKRRLVRVLEHTEAEA